MGSVSGVGNTVSAVMAADVPGSGSAEVGSAAVHPHRIASTDRDKNTIARICVVCVISAGETPFFLLLYSYILHVLSIFVKYLFRFRLTACVRVQKSEIDKFMIITICYCKKRKNMI